MNEKNIQRWTVIRRISAWAMLALFVLLVLNLLIFHVMTALSAIVYLSLVAVFFLGNGLRGGSQAYGQLEQDEAGEEFGTGEDNGSGEDDGSEHEAGIVEAGGAGNEDGIGKAD